MLPLTYPTECGTSTVVRPLTDAERLTELRRDLDADLHYALVAQRYVRWPYGEPELAAEALYAATIGADAAEAAFSLVVRAAARRVRGVGRHAVCRVDQAGPRPTAGHAGRAHRRRPARHLREPAMSRRLIAYLRATRLDLDLAGYAAMVAALAVATGLIGPTLDARSTLTACEGCGKTAVAAKE